jgi:hypothetical protein
MYMDILFIPSLNGQVLESVDILRNFYCYRRNEKMKNK